MLHPDRLRQPYHWKNKRVFVNSLSDVFHVDVPDDFIIKMFEVMAATVWCPYRNVYQILTKRPERMRRLIPAVWEAIESRDYARQTVMESIHLGVSISTMDDAWRADMLRTTPAAVRFLSLEPLLGPIEPKVLGGMDWVIVGGESGPGWRPMDLEWARDLRAYAGGGAGIPFFFKQVAASKPTDEMIPEDLRIREYPAPEAPDYALTHINPSLKVRQLATVTKGT
jgi:protein gp37